MNNNIIEVMSKCQHKTLAIWATDSAAQMHMWILMPLMQLHRFQEQLVVQRKILMKNVNGFRVSSFLLLVKIIFDISIAFYCIYVIILLYRYITIL
jgi:cyanate permease